MGIARYLSKLASGLSPEGVIPASKGGTGTTSGGSGGPKITNIQVTDSSYNVLDDTAVDVAGGYIKITGSGFTAGCQVLVGTIAATSVTFVSATEVRAQLPATTAGSYIVYLVNSDGGVAIRVNGVTFSTVPSWNTTSPLSGLNNNAFSIQLNATGASTYSLAPGSTLPSGVTLTSGGLLSGTVSGISATTAYNFTVLATDAELQDSPRAFTLNISLSSDPNFANTYALFNFNGTNGTTIYQDKSANNLTFTSTGTVAPTLSTAQSKYGGSSLLFTGRTGNIASPTTAVIGTGDYTMEGWVYLTNSSSAYVALFGMGSSHFRFGDGGFGNRLQVGTNLDSLSACWNAPVTHSTFLNTWKHVAFTRQSGVCRVFIDGVQQNLGNGANPSTFTSSSFTSTQNLGTVSCNIGMGNSGGYGWVGYQDDVRFTVGLARYTTSFTPPTELS
jgi:hypothetical protein